MKTEIRIVILLILLTATLASWNAMRVSKQPLQGLRELNDALIRENKALIELQQNSFKEGVLRGLIIERQQPNVLSPEEVERMAWEISTSKQQCERKAK